MLKKRGHEGEKVAIEYYKKKGYILLSQNYTIRGGEIDLIFDYKNTIVFVEVKVVDSVNDIFGYISPKKIAILKKTIGHYCLRENISGPTLQVDFVFVKDGLVREIYNNVHI